MIASDVPDATAEAAMDAHDVAMSGASTPPTTVQRVAAFQAAVAAAMNAGFNIGGPPPDPPI